MIIFLEIIRCVVFQTRIIRAILNWLTGLEYNAFKAYQDAARVFAHDPALTRLLNSLARDELLHYYALRTAETHLDPSIKITPAATLDDELRREIERPFGEFAGRLRAGELTREELIKAIVTIEFSELNHLFSYVVNTLKDSTNEFNALEENISQHKEDVEEYISTLSESGDILKQLNRLPVVFKKTILIVEDNVADANLLKSILETEGQVEIAANGKEALALVLKKSYNAVISDIEMPEMDGLEFFLRATAEFPELKDLFLFYTARKTPENLSFFSENKVKHLFKPSPITEIRKTVKEMIR